MKILLAGFHKPETMSWYLEKSLKKGHEVDFFCYRSIFQGVDAEQTVSKAFRHVPVLNRVYQKKMNSDLLSKVRSNEYDAVIVLKGETIMPRTLEEMKKHTALVNWTMDPMTALEKGSMFESIPLYDHFIVKDTFVKSRLEELGFDNVRFLLEGFDPAMYKKIHLSEDEEQRYGADISFVGNIYPYRQRLLQSFKEKDFKAWGMLAHGVQKNSVGWCYQGRKAITEEKNKIFNAAKIVFNSHNPWEVSGANVRLFEICGSGAFQLTDTTQYTHNIFKIGKEIACYNNIKELKELTGYYLENEDERKKIANAGHERALNDHSYDVRIKELVRIIKS